MDPENSERLNQEVRRVWDANAAWWDDYIGGEGNTFHRTLVAPTEMRLLNPRLGERILDVACGNGQFSRELARVGAEVVAFDFSETFIEKAKDRTREAGINDIDFRVIDATNEKQMLSLGEGSYDAAVCTMALMDMVDVDSPLRSIVRLLKPGGRFVFSVPHPCFNSGGTKMMAEMDDQDGELLVSYAVKVTSYFGQSSRRGVGIPGQPHPHMYFDRTLSELLDAGFRAGMVMDGIDEPTFPEGTKAEGVFGWANYTSIPPLLTARMRAP